METKYRVCYLSEIGHRNFWYPTRNSALYYSECEFESLNWVSGQSSKLKAIKIRKSCILPLNIDGQTVDNISPPGSNTYTVVWIDNKNAP
jgi:hypothetical protein